MTEVKFEFQTKNKGVVSAIINIPATEHPNEIAFRVIKQNRIPFYNRKDVLQKLHEFCEVETEKYYDSEERLKCDFSDAQLVEKWSSLFTEEWAEYAKSETVDHEDSPSFAEMYHSLIHSPALETMLNLERTRASFIEELVRERDESVVSIQKRQSEEMEIAVSKVSISVTDKDINDLAAKHFQESQKVLEDWNTKIGDLKKLQKKEFHEWVTKVYEDYKSGSLQLSNPVYEQSDDSQQINDDAWIPQQKKLEESFTIHLGSQLKVTHNLRLLSANVLDFCRHKSFSENLVLQPQRLQTAMSLYSNSLSGLVLLVDNRINSYTGIKREFARVCQLSTELHFADLEEQMSNIDGLASRSSRAKKRESEHGGSKSSNFLKPGDFYVTRHSNLSEVHVAFHLVTDDSVLSSDINSRHPVILGLRQILRVAHEWDVCSISLPLLLAQEMAEEMTIPWCLKRAELVFKCIKGFMIEMASLTGDETRTVQFIVPKGISEEFFSNLLTMLPSIFRVSNPLVLKSR